MKLNEDWDQVYRSATLSLQQRMAALELENTAIKELNSRLLLRVEHQQVHTKPTAPGTGKKCCWWWWWWWLCNKNHQWLLLELSGLELFIRIKLISGAGICNFLLSSFYFSCCNVFFWGRNHNLQIAVFGTESTSWVLFEIILDGDRD